MKEFIHKYEDRIHGVLSCFDRMLFRGYLREHHFPNVYSGVVH